MRSVQRGVTLLEMVVVIVIVALAFAALAGLFAMAGRALPLNERLQGAGQLAQACAERILSARHTPGFVFNTPAATLQATYCDAASTGYTLSLAESAGPIDASLCPTAVTCRAFTVSVTPSPSGDVSSRLDFLLVQ